IFTVVLISEGVLIVQVRQLLQAHFVRAFLAWVIPVVHLKVMRHTRCAATKQLVNQPTSTTSPGTTAKAPAGAGSPPAASSTNELTLVGNDLLRVCDDLRMGLFSFVASLVGIVGGIAGLLYLVGFPALVGMLFMFGYVVFSTKVSRSIMAPIVRKETAIADSRLTTMREMVAGIQQVKYLTWEENYLQLLFNKRKQELREILRFRF
ncbi:unnamed protein product, partial [Amoebophrya sp. A120]